LGIEILTNTKKSFQKDFWKYNPILTLQKFIITIWLSFQKKWFHGCKWDTINQHDYFKKGLDVFLRKNNFFIRMNFGTIFFGNLL
jgi:hypothetical protein